ncbi:MAG: stage III sporulation protein AF [Peptococcaceae bacterium]|jgi:stage III sporulation protein AF|nr:stage III sporulation protein AF [Peptococcaceae bacterium]
MEGLKEIIRNLAFILLLATFLEMLLPSKKMKGFVQLIMGLFVIAAILNPLANFLKLDYQMKVPAWFTRSFTEMPVLAAEGSNGDLGNILVREQYKKILISQIETLISPLVIDKKITVKVELDKTESISDYPQVLKIIVLVDHQNIDKIIIDPVVIGEKEITHTESALALKIKKQIASFMLIPEEKIIVNEK